MFRFMLLAAALAAIASSSAAAPVKDPLATATVKWKYKPQDHIIVEETLWRCVGDTCTGALTDTPSLASRACRIVAAQTGAVIRFSLPSGDLNQAALDRCNRR